MSTQPFIKAKDYHIFGFKGGRYIFNSEDVQVKRATPLEEIILTAVKNGCRSEQELLQRSGTHDPVTIHGSVQGLLDQGFLNNDKFPVRDRKPNKAPYYTFMVNVAQKCNLSCKYCYTHQGSFDYRKKPEEAMSVQTGLQLVNFIFDQFRSAEKITFHFYGGEPLLNFECIKAIVEVSEKKASESQTVTDFAVTTNGTRIGPTIAEFFNEHGFTVFLSIDGPESVHDQFRLHRDGHGSFLEVRKNFELLKNLPNIFIIGSSVIRRDWSLADAISFLTALGVHQYKAERVWLPEDSHINLTAMEKKQYQQDIRALYDHYLDAIKQFRKPLDYRLNSKLLQLLQGVKRTHFCQAGDQTFGISASGELYPCSLHVGRSQAYLGDLTNGFDLERVKAFQEAYCVDNAAECRSCWARYLCGGGCSAMVDRFGRNDCEFIRAETETAIAIYQTIMDTDPILLLNLVAPSYAKWAIGES